MFGRIQIDGPTPRISSAPKYDRTMLVLRLTEYIVELHSEPVEMSNMERSKVVVKGIVQ